MSDLAVAAPQFEILGVTPDPLTATPTLRFEVGINDDSGRDIYTIAITAQVNIDADRRGYDEPTRERLQDLFGEPERIPQTAGALLWARVEALAPSFTGHGSVVLDVPVNGDIELAAMRYFDALSDGTVPLTFHFSGTVFASDEFDRLKLTLVPWSCSARYRLKLSVWRELIENRYAAGGFVRLHADTIEKLRRVRVRRGFHTFDEAIAAALEVSG